MHFRVFSLRQVKELGIFLGLPKFKSFGVLEIPNFFFFLVGGGGER